MKQSIGKRHSSRFGGQGRITHGWLGLVLVVALVAGCAPDISPATAVPASETPAVDLDIDSNNDNAFRPAGWSPETTTTPTATRSRDSLTVLT